MRQQLFRWNNKFAGTDKSQLPSTALKQSKSVTWTCFRIFSPSCSRGGSQAASELGLDGSPVQPSSHVHDLGVQFDDDLSLKKHVDQLTGRCYSQLRLIRSCRRDMTCESIKTVVNSLSFRRLTTVTVYSPPALNSRQTNCSVSWTVLRVSSLVAASMTIDHVTPMIRDDLHWLHVHERVTFKLCLLDYKALHGLAPVYIKSMCVQVSSSTARSLLHLASRGHLIVPRTRLEFGKLTFAFAGPTAWNSLPDIIRSAKSINTFKRLGRNEVEWATRLSGTVKVFDATE